MISTTRGQQAAEAGTPRKLRETAEERSLSDSPQGREGECFLERGGAARPPSPPL